MKGTHNMISRTLLTYFIDDDEAGRIKYTMGNWDGILYRIPRLLVNSCTDRPEYKYAGIYFLFGEDEESNRKVVYIGQANVRKNGEGLIGRVREHVTSRESFWSEAIIATATNDSLGATDLNYLEHTFCSMALKANRYIVKNGNDPNAGHPSEEQLDRLDGFISTTVLILNQAQHKGIFEPVNPSSSNDDLLFLTYSTASGKGKMTSEGFVVLKDSTLRTENTNTCPRSALAYREKYKDVIRDGRLIEDVLLSSPSAAASFLGGASMNGWDSWKNADGVPLKQLGK